MNSIFDDIESLVAGDPYNRGLSHEHELSKMFARLQAYHRDSCPDFDRLVDVLFEPLPTTLNELAYVPVGLFKRRQLKSVPDEDIYRTLHSSGTTSQTPSQIFLDQATAQLQRRALSNVMQYHLGPRRLPMLIVDSEQVISKRDKFSARAAGIIGMMNFGRSHTFVLDDDMKLNLKAIREFMAKFEGEQILVFGFTFMVFEYLLEAMSEIHERFDDAILVHSGGWKKLRERAVDRTTFNRLALESCGIQRVHNFYGMVEQIGSVFLDCSEGHFHPSKYSTVLVRDPLTIKSVPDGRQGLIQVMSVLPLSYPGHSILTEDLGRIVHRGACPCGIDGLGFVMEGRLPRAELRGCSDTYEQGHG